VRATTTPRGIIARGSKRVLFSALAAPACKNRRRRAAVESAFRIAIGLRRAKNDTRSIMMKRLFALAGITLALSAGISPALAQSSPPPLPELTAQQSATVQQRLDAYRRQTEARVSHGEITPDEADNLLKWREWQIARQVAGVARAPQPNSDVPPDYQAAQQPSNVPPDYYGAPQPSGDVPPDYYGPPPQPGYVVVQPAPYYGPYYRYRAPYWGPYPYYWGPSVCAGGFGRHFGGRICF
jgi:hypothetical protein